MALAECLNWINVLLEPKELKIPIRYGPGAASPPGNGRFGSLLYQHRQNHEEAADLANLSAVRAGCSLMDVYAEWRSAALRLPHHPPGLIPARIGIVERGSDDALSLGLVAQRDQHRPIVKAQLRV
jgi:hypothetical protein